MWTDPFAEMGQLQLNYKLSDVLMKMIFRKMKTEGHIKKGKIYTEVGSMCREAWQTFNMLKDATEEQFQKYMHSYSTPGSECVLNGVRMMPNPNKLPHWPKERRGVGLCCKPHSIVKPSQMGIQRTCGGVLNDWNHHLIKYYICAVQLFDRRCNLAAEKFDIVSMVQRISKFVSEHKLARQVILPGQLLLMFIEHLPKPGGTSCAIFGRRS